MSLIKAFNPFSFNIITDTYVLILAWRIPGTGEPGGLHLWGYTESDTTEAT